MSRFLLTTTALVVSCQLSGCRLFVAGAVAGGALGAGVHAGVMEATKHGPRYTAAGDSMSALLGAPVTVTFAVARHLDAVRASNDRDKSTPARARGNASDAIPLSSVVWVAGRVVTVRNDSLVVVLTEAFSGAGHQSFSGTHEVVVARDTRMSIRAREIPVKRSLGRSIVAGALLGILGAGVWLAVSLYKMDM